MTRPKQFVSTSTENVRSPNSSVETASVYRPDGDATMKMIVGTTLTRWTAVASSARMEPSSANPDTVSRRTSGVTAIGTAETCPMKSVVLRDTLAEDTVLKAGEL